MNNLLHTYSVHVLFVTLNVEHLKTCHYLNEFANGSEIKTFIHSSTKYVSLVSYVSPHIYILT